MFRRDFFRGMFGGAAALKLPEVKSAEILRLESNDTIVITLHDHPTTQDLERIKVLVESRFPGQKVLVKESNIDISIIKG